MSKSNIVVQSGPRKPLHYTDADFERIKIIGQGSYGVVYKARNLRTSGNVALKTIYHGSKKSDICCTTLREILILQDASHKNIIDLQGLIINRENVTLVLEYFPMDLHHYLSNLEPSTGIGLEMVQHFLYQMVSAVSYCHRLDIMHRDLKPSNILFNRNGVLKLADFGLGRYVDKQNTSKLSPDVVTLWYRAPELLLGETRYTKAIDIWSIGCIFAELITNRVLFRGNSEINQLITIFKVMTTPNERIWPGVSKLPYFGLHFPRFEHFSLHRYVQPLDQTGLHLLYQMLLYDVRLRYSADDILNHSFFKTYNEAFYV